MSHNHREPLLEAETFWHQCLLTAILVIAACSTFYAIDQYSLSSNELSNLLACKDGWFAMATAYRSQTGMPPLYPSLLCELTELTSTAEFFVRLLPALAGLAAIYMLYVTGRDFLTSSAGLMAAAIMATNYFQAVIFYRQATYPPVLLLGFLAHSYCFCRLFFFNDSNLDKHNSRPFCFSFAGKHSEFQWTWHPNLPCDGRFLVGFWMTGILVFYTSNTSLILLGTEFLASISLVSRCISPEYSREKLLRCLWIPLLVGALPWLPILYGFHQWILAGNLFAIPDGDLIWRSLLPLFPPDPALQKCLVALLAVFILFIVAIKLLRKQHWLNMRYVSYIHLQLFTALCSLWFIQVNDFSSYLYYWWIFILLLMTPLAILINLIKPSLKPYILASILLITVVVQTSSNVHYKLYRIAGDADFRLAAQIIHDDQSFMDSPRKIYISSNLFVHYLDAYNIIVSPVNLIDDNITPDKLNHSLESPGFYYLEYSPYDREFAHDTPAFQTLSTQYKTVCLTKMPWIHIARFSKESASSSVAPDCRSNLASQVSLK